MINTNRSRSKYIIPVDVPSGTERIEYKVMINSTDEDDVIFVGQSKYFGNKYELEIGDWINNYIEEQYENDLTCPWMYLRINIYFYVDNSASMKSITFPWQPETIDITKPDYEVGIVGGTGTGIAEVMKSSANYPYMMAIYPTFYFRINGTFKESGSTLPPRPIRDALCLFDPNLEWYPDNIKKDTYKYTAMSEELEGDVTEDEWDEDVRDDFHNWVVEQTNPQILKDADSPLYYSPKFIVELPTRPEVTLKKLFLDHFVDRNMPKIEPIYFKQFTSKDEVASLNDFFFSYSEQKLDNYFDTYVKTWVQDLENSLYTFVNGDMLKINTIDRVGYGYKVIISYRGEGSFTNKWGLVSQEYIVGSIKGEDECYSATLSLVNSGFVFGTESFKNEVTFDLNQHTTTKPTTITIPLKVKNGMLVGKTINNIDKITYMDRYGDTHNASITNHYELECYIDDDWLGTLTGNDINFEKLELAMQAAQKTYLCTNAKISGMDGGDTMIEGRVKDVQKIETYSSYHTGNKIPSYKITFEIYR